MPRGDRTGPYGEGPRTGRGMGYCAGNDAPGYAVGGPGMGRGAGRGWGWRDRAGRRHRHWFRTARWDRFAPADWGPIPPEVVAKQEIADLESDAGWLSIQLDAIHARIEELKGLAKVKSEDEES